MNACVKYSFLKIKKQKNKNHFMSHTYIDVYHMLQNCKIVFVLFV